jgi:hypothetical protein
MTLSNLISDHSSVTASLVACRRQKTGPVRMATPEHATRQQEIDRVVRQIRSPDVRDIIGTVFQDLLRLLECLDLIEGHLRQVDAAEETFALFQLIHDEARSLVEFIRTDALNCEVMTEDLADTLDGITFALNHDLQRVFEADSRVPLSEGTSHVVVGRLYRAHDLLTNCLQQSTITLSMVFDSELVGARLFNNSDMRFRQSLQLCQDLSALIELVENYEETRTELALPILTAGLERFRNDSMECLMYSDWPQFESFCERIKLSTTQLPDLESVLHQFRCYLETLLGQVRMRAVLANVFPVQFGDNNCYLPTAAGENPAPFSASFDLKEDEAAWDTFALAV